MEARSCCPGLLGLAGTGQAASRSSSWGNSRRAASRIPDAPSVVPLGVHHQAGRRAPAAYITGLPVMPLARRARQAAKAGSPSRSRFPPGTGRGNCPRWRHIACTRPPLGVVAADAALRAGPLWGQQLREVANVLEDIHLLGALDCLVEAFSSRIHVFSQHSPLLGRSPR